MRGSTTIQPLCFIDDRRSGFKTNETSASCQASQSTLLCHPRWWKVFRFAEADEGKPTNCFGWDREATVKS
jgi:hypothetical protein